jgi:hypothetical protein
MTRARRFLLAALVAASALAWLPAHAEYAFVDYGPHRFLRGSMTKSGVTATFYGIIQTGAFAGSFFGQPFVSPYVDEMFGHVRVQKGSSVRDVWGSYTVTVDPALATAKITGSAGGVAINVTMTGTGNPGPDPRTPDPNGIDPPGWLDVYSAMNITRTAGAAGNVTSPIGSISAGSGTGSLTSGIGGSIFYVDF